jgi:tetratricopeptide (TPR) repeat protein
LAKRHEAPDMIEEFESAAERLAHWIAQNAWTVGGVLVVVLGTAAAWGGFHSWSRAREEAASNDLDRVRVAYMSALGASPGAVEAPELANPLAAAAIREEYVETFRGVADEHTGTVAGTLALFEVATLLDQLDRSEQSAETWRQAAAGAGDNPGLEGLLHQRIAEAHEARAEWAEAAAAHERAGEIPDYPPRYWALLDAARCRAAAGELEAALALYDRVQVAAPDLSLPPHVRAQSRELRAALGR